jgi:mannose-6-phosphate isomerase
MKISKLYPECKDYLWGGERLKTKYNKKTDRSPCAESWELSFHEAGLSRTDGGDAISDIARAVDLGTRAMRFSHFPMLIKFIDAASDLSVQVHPSDEYAMEHEASYGKSEAWYIVEAEAGAGIYLGFKRSVTREEYAEAIADGSLTELLNFYEVRAGECYFIPAGTVHAIGRGCLIYEIQQNSNLTYRVYDYGRRDKDGRERELHIEKALSVTDLRGYERPDSKSTHVECKYFRAERLSVRGESRLYADEGSFTCVTCIFGFGEIDGEQIKTGDSFFVPAGYGEYTLFGDMEIILADIPEEEEI